MQRSKVKLHAAAPMTAEDQATGRRHVILLNLNEPGMRLALKAHAEACQAFLKPLTWGEVNAVGACMLERLELNELANKFSRAHIPMYIGQLRYNIASAKAVMDVYSHLAGSLGKHIGCRVMLKDIVLLGIYEIVAARDEDILATTDCVSRLTKTRKRLAPTATN